jgi:putative hydrolase of the HAD superfamily
MGEMEEASLRDLVTHHVAWQFESLGVPGQAHVPAIVDRFVRDVEEAAAVNRRVLADLVAQGVILGVVSNACGNAARLCDEYGYASMLSVIVDSHKFGASKPDPSIFRHALKILGVRAERTGFVGDSLICDIEPAKTLGMRTFWIAGPGAHPAPAADAVLGSLADLPASLLQFDLRAV